MENLSIKQYVSICLAVLVSINFIILPYISTNILANLLGHIIPLLFLWLYIGKGLCINVNNKFVSSILLIRFMISASLIIALFCKISSETLLKDGNEYILLLIVFLISVYCGRNNSALIVSRVLYVFILIFILLLVCLSFSDVKFDNIISDFYSKSSINLFIILPISLISMVFELPAVLSGLFKMKIKTTTALIPIIIAALVNILIVVCITGRFGSANSFYKYPSFELMFSSDISGYFIQRQHGLIIPALLMGLMLFAGLNIYFTNTIKKVFNFKYLNYFIIFVISLIIIFFDNPWELYIYSNIIGGIVVFVLLFLGGEKCNEN